MKLQNLLKKDKWFSLKIVLIIFIVIYALSFVNVQKKEAQQRQSPEVCDGYNTLSNEWSIPFLTDDSKLQACSNQGCYVEVFRNFNPLNSLIFSTGKKCVSYVETGKLTYNNPEDACQQEGGIKLSETDKFTKCGDVLGECYQCTVPSESDYKPCIAWMTPFANIAKTVVPGMDCSSRSYIVMTIFGLIIFIVLFRVIGG
jgi:hypothetical protein